ncbi:uncharacterized protein [Antedon mediterranea]|uniref:uncharacterized protein n=1 Tax=Antedon mediterranea TaxID=105859 RepID=UPI003AF8ED8E
MRTGNFYVTGLIQVAMFVTAATYPSGAPEDACSKMSPNKGHNNSKQTSASPYTISMSSAYYSPGQIITVTISGTDYFKGVMLQARSTGTENSILQGSFSRLPETLQYLTCNNISNSTVTHTNASDKQRIEVDWVAPQEFIGKIKFYATIVKNISIYWVGQKSDALKEQVVESTDEPYVTSILTETFEPVSPTVHITTEDDLIEEETVTPVDLNNSTLGYTDYLLNITNRTLPPSESMNTTTTTYSIESSNITENTTLPNVTISTTIITEKPDTTSDYFEDLFTYVPVHQETQTQVTTAKEIPFTSTKNDSEVIPTNLSVTRSTFNRTVTFSTQSTEQTNYNLSETSLPPTTSVQEKITFEGNRPTTEITTEVMQSLETTTTVELEDSITEVVSDSTLYDGKYYSQTTTPPIATATITADIEIHSGNANTMVTNLVDTSVVFKMTITSLEFTDSLNDPTSNEFTELADNLQTTMEDVYSTWEGFQECKIIGFSKGSVISETELVFENALSDEEKSATVGEIYTLVEENGGIGNFTVSSIQTLSSEGTYEEVDHCSLLPCPVNLNCHVEDSKCVLSCQENTDFCQNGECEVDEDGKNLTCKNTTVDVEPVKTGSNETVIAMVLIGASFFLIVLSIILIVFICKLWRKRRRRWRRRQNQDIQLFGFEANKHTRLNGGIPVTDVSATRGRFFVNSELNEAPFFSSHPAESNLMSGRGSIGSTSQHSVFDRAFSSAAHSDIDEPDYDYDVINRNRSVKFLDTPQILGDEQSAEEFGIENFSFGVPKYVDREDDAGSYRVRWDFKVDDPAVQDMDIAL